MYTRKYTCRICGNSENNKVYNIKEMMFGLGEEFMYFECSKCGALQITEVPKNLEKYYPEDYYSYNINTQSINIIKKFLRRKLHSYLIWKQGIVGRLLSYIHYNSEVASIGDVEGINKDSKILDVGCGRGRLLHILRDLGFKHLYGVDPYIEEDIIDKNITIWKKTIYDIPSSIKFDLIMFHHSLEHMLDQLETLREARYLLSKNGTILVRIPIKSEYIWHKYKTHWVQIDAPRHFIIHTLKSFEILTKKVGLKIEKIVFDSTNFQFWGSELYKMGVPLVVGSKDIKAYFSTEQLWKWGRQSKKLNKLQQGDQAVFYLKPVS